MSFKNWLNEVENRGGGGNIRIPDGRPTAMRSGRSGEDQHTPGQPQINAPNVHKDPKIPSSSMSPSDAIPKSKTPGGAFGGGSRLAGWPFEPLKASSFGGPAPPINFTSAPSTFANTLKWAKPASGIFGA